MPTESSAQTRRRKRLDAAFAQEERRAQSAAAPVVLVGVAVITAYITWENGFPAALFFYPFMFGFAMLGYGPLLFWRGSPPWWERYLRFTLSVVLSTVLMLLPTPFREDVRSPAMMLRWQNELYLFVFVAAAAFTYSPRVVLWTGFVAALAWTAAGLWTLSLPQTTGGSPIPDLATMSVHERQLALMDPDRVLVAGLVRTVLALLIVAATLAAFVRRSRQIVLRQAEAERERDNLSRYFSAKTVEELAQSDLPLSTTRRQNAAVLFVDIVGFTAASAREEPEAVIETLRQFHHLVERAVFASDGTLEKYIGDGAMATFGTPQPGPSDATNALLCTRALVESLAAWNESRRRSGREPIRIGIGLHFGPVVLGDIGGEQRLEFAVVGDTVNVASRLERLTREVRSDLVISGDLIDAARREGTAVERILPDLQQAPSREVRGREGTLRVWLQGIDSTPRPVAP